MDYLEIENNLIIFNELMKGMKSTLPENIRPIVLKYLQQSNVHIEQIQKELERLKQNIIKSENENKILDNVMTSAGIEQILKAVYTKLYVVNGLLEGELEYNK